MNKTEICNLALSILKSTPINDIDSKDDAKSHLCKIWYDIKRQNLLKENNWRFAIKEANLSKNTKDNFNLPSDLIRIIKFSDQNAIQIGQEVKSSQSNLQLTYIKDVKDTWLFTPEFKEVLFMSIAHSISFDLVGDRSVSQCLENQYLKLLAKAKENLEYPIRKKESNQILYSVDTYKMLKKKVFIQHFKDGQITEERLNMQNSATKLENFVVDKDSTYFRGGFKLLFPTFNKQKAKIIPFGEEKFIELTEKTIRIIENNKLKIKKTLKVKSSIKDKITTEDEHNLKEEDEIYLSFKTPENFAKIDFIYKVENIISKTSFKITERSYIPDQITEIKVIQKIDIKETLNLESIRYTTTDKKIFFIDTKNEKPKTFFYYDEEKESFDKKTIHNFPKDFYPESIGYYENRLILASKSKIYLSRINSPFDFDIGSSIYSAMFYEFNFGQKENILFCYPGLRNLIIATNLNLYISITKENFLESGKVIFKRISAFGTTNKDPVMFGDDIIYIDKTQKSIRFLTYNYKEEDIKNFDLTIFTKQFENLSKLVLEKDFIYALSDDGYILKVNIRSKENELVYGSFSKIKRKIGKFYDILTTQDDLYTVTEKNNEYFIEKAQNKIDLPEEYNFLNKEEYLEKTLKKQKEIIHTDSSIEFDGKRKIKISVKNNKIKTEQDFFEDYMKKDFIVVNNKNYKITEVISKKEITTQSTKEETAEEFFYAPTTIKNLDYLENNKISILNNGSPDKEQIIQNCQIKIPNGIKYGTIGIKYEGTIITQPLVASLLDSFTAKSIDKILLRVKNSKNFYIGWNLNNMQEVSFTGFTHQNNEPVPLYTGDITPNIPSSGWDTFKRLFILKKTPTPLSIQGVYYEASITS